METQDDTTMVMGQNSAQPGPGDEAERHPADDPCAPDRVEINGYTQAEFKHAAIEIVLDHLPIGVVIVEAPSGRLIAGNKKIEAIWRRPVLAQLHFGEHNLWHSYHPDGRPYTAEEWPMSRAIHSGEVVRDEEIHIARGDDTWGIIGMSAAPIRDRSGKVVAGIISCHDITDRKQMEEALCASEEAFKAVTENAPDLIARFDRDFRHLFVSSAIQQVTGIEPEAFTGKTYRELGMPEQLCDQWDRVLQSVFDTGKRTSIEFDYPDAQGVIHTYQMHAGPEHSSDNSVRSVLTIARDITEQKRASQILHTQYDVTRVLAETDDLSDGLRKALQIICVGVGWDLGVMWIVDRDANLLRYSTLWHSPSIEGAAFDRHSRDHFFVPGMDVPGRVWASGIPIWMSDVTADARFSRTALVTRMEQRAAVTLPVRNRNEIVAVMEFLSHEVRPPDEELIQTLSALGNQIGIFIERKRTEQSLALRVRQQACVAELGHTALTQHDIGSLMDQAVAAVAKTLGVDYAQVFELSTDGTTFLMRAGVGWEQHLIGHYTVAAHADSHSGYTLLAREPIVVEDFREETRFSGAPLLHEHNILSGMSVVVYGHGRPFGVLSVYHMTRRRFTCDDIHFLQSVANVLAAAAERQRADDVLHLSLNNTRELYTVSQRIGLANTFDDILQVLLSSSYLRHSSRAEIALFDRAWVHIGEPPHGVITLAAWSRTVEKQPPIPGCRLVEDIAWLDKMQIRYSPLYVDDVEHDQRLKEQCRRDLLGQNIRSTVIFPLVASGQPFGVISFLFEQSRAVSKSDIRYIQGLIDQAAVAIHNIRLLQTEAEAR